jgi:hypothetical protein
MVVLWAPDTEKQNIIALLEISICRKYVHMFINLTKLLSSSNNGNVSVKWEYFWSYQNVTTWY